MNADASRGVCERKFVDLVLDEVETDGTFSGYASLFGKVDLGKDVVERGAFARSLRTRGAAASDSEDELLSGLIRAAREDVERTTGVALIDQAWRLVLDAWPQQRLRCCCRGIRCAKSCR